MNMKKILVLGMLILGLSLLIGGVSADSVESIPCPNDKTHNATKTKSIVYKDYEGIVKINKSYYKKYYIEEDEDIYCNNWTYAYYNWDKEYCGYSDYSTNYYYKYVKCKANELVDTGTSLKYWKTVKSKGKTYKYYKQTTTNIYGDTHTTKTTKIRKQLLKSYNKKISTYADDYGYNNGYVKITPSKSYMNGRVRGYDYVNERYATAPVYAKKFKISKIGSKVKITKVIAKSIGYPSYKRYSSTYKNPKNGKWFAPSKYKAFDKFIIYYNFKKYVWIN